jgi:tripeptidyl-peptidase-1
MPQGGIITTGGGFSNIYTVPSWQSAQVTAYLDGVDGTSKAPVTGFGNGRGYPDVSLMALNYVIVANLSYSPVSGTSASTPVSERELH